MSRDLIVVSKFEEIARAIKLISDHNIHHLPVVDDDILVRIISTTDIDLALPGKSFFLNQQLEDTRQPYSEVNTVTSIMSTDLLTIEPKATIFEAYTIF